MISASSLVYTVGLLLTGCCIDASSASFLQDFSAIYSSTRSPSRIRTFSEERIEKKEVALFGWPTTPRRRFVSFDDPLLSFSEWSTTTSRPFHSSGISGATRNPFFDDWFSASKSASSEEHQVNPNSGFVPRLGSTRKPTTSKPDFLTNILIGSKKESAAVKWCKKFETECLKRSPETDDDTISTGLRSRIIGGRAATPKKHTYMVLIGYGLNKRKRQWSCGGSLISKRYVLTAAHCTEGGLIGAAKWARVGELDLSTDGDDAKPQDREIVARIRHPKYKEPAVYNDVALLKLDADVVFNDWVSPICLQTSKYLDNSRATVAGWGRVDFISETSPILLEVNINIFNNSECSRLMADAKDMQKLPRGIDTETMLCAGEIQGGKDACSGDSGGPLFVEDGECTMTQVGITSMGRDCGLPNSPGIYTNVVQFVPWIESIVWGKE